MDWRTWPASPSDSTSKAGSRRERLADLQVTNRIDGATDALVEACQIEVCVRATGLRLNRVLIGADGLLRSPLILQGNGKVEGGGGVVRTRLQGLTVVRFGRGKFTRFVKQPTKVDVSVGVDGIDSQRTAVGLDRMAPVVLLQLAPLFITLLGAEPRSPGIPGGNEGRNLVHSNLCLKIEQALSCFRTPPRSGIAGDDPVLIRRQFD